MGWVIARQGERIFAFRKENVISVIMDPVITEVPEAKEDIRGISFYENRLVVYYQTGQRGSGRLGILVSSENDKWTGAVVEAILDEREFSQQDFVTVAPGIWEKQRD